MKKVMLIPQTIWKAILMLHMAVSIRQHMLGILNQLYFPKFAIGMAKVVLSMWIMGCLLYEIKQIYVPVPHTSNGQTPYIAS